jgi:hypothetical protein
MTTTTRDLDRLVSQTEMDPVSKRALRHVRKAVISGRATDPSVHDYDWSIGVESRNGAGVRVTFTLRKAKPSVDAA